MKNFLFMLLFLHKMTAQIVFTGLVSDNTTGNTLPYVNIHINNTTIGAITNSDGRFSIRIPKKYFNEYLIFSYIGYKSINLNISDLQKDNINDIKLLPTNLDLDEIVLTTKKININDVVRKAFKNFSSNYPSDPFISKAFLRHTEKTKKEYKWLVEAALEIYDPGFRDSPKKIKTNVVEVRKSIDNRYIDTLAAYRFYSKHILGKSNRTTWNKNFSIDRVNTDEIQKSINYHDNMFTLKGWKENFFYSLLSTDHNKLRYFGRNNAVLDNQILKTHTFKLDTVLLDNDVKIYKIKISPKDPPASLNRFKKDKELPVGWIYIRNTDFAIVELTYYLIENTKKSSLNSKIFGSKIASAYTIKFSEFNGKMYPKYLSLTSPKGNRFIEALDGLHQDAVITDNDLHYFTKQEILFTEQITSKKIINQYLNKSWDNNLFTPRDYNPTFWESYNILLESKEETKMIKDLEKKTSLKQQFEQK